jgi:hypothetical protein
MMDDLDKQAELDAMNDMMEDALLEAESIIDQVKAAGEHAVLTQKRFDPYATGGFLKEIRRTAETIQLWQLGCQL